jgi:hypothetical protein
MVTPPILLHPSREREKESLHTLHTHNFKTQTPTQSITLEEKKIFLKNKKIFFYFVIVYITNL